MTALPATAMSGGSISPSQLIAHYHAVRMRLRRAPNSHFSTNLDVIPGHKFRRLRFGVKPPAAEPERAAPVPKPELIETQEQMPEHQVTLPLDPPPEQDEPPMLPIDTPKPLQLRDIALACCGYLGVSASDFLSYRRPADVCHARHVAYYLARHLTQRSLPAIGRFYGNRDHTTILHGVQKIERLLLHDGLLRGQVAAIKEILNSQYLPPDERKDPCAVIRCDKTLEMFGGAL